MTEFEITAERIRTGRSTTDIRISWQKKVDMGAQISAVEELERSTIGRQARMNQEVEDISTITSSQKSDSLGEGSHISNFLPDFKEEQTSLWVSASAIEKAKEIILDSKTRLDVYVLEQEFLEYAQKSKFEPDNVDGAFIGFVKKKIGKPRN